VSTLNLKIENAKTEGFWPKLNNKLWVEMKSLILSILQKNKV
jgi:hypothetical protein